MCSVLSLIALDANDLRVFGEILAFYPLPCSLETTLFYPSSLQADTVERIPGLHLHSFATPLPAIPCQHPQQLVFATERSCAAYLAGSHTAYIPLWDHPRYAIAVTRDLDPSPLLEQRFVKLDNVQVLRGEDSLRQAFPDPKPRRAQSYATFSRQDDASAVLATTDQNMLEAWLETHAGQSCLWYLGKDLTALVLRNPTDDAAFNLAYRQFAAFCEAIAKHGASSCAGRDQVRAAFDAAKAAYGFFAEYYDKYMSHVSYSDWLEMIMRWAKKFMDHPPVSILELACGTANISEQLVYQGFSVDACDLSPFMLHVAQRKLFKPNLFRHDMALPLNITERYDLILCLFDSINYLLDEKGIDTMLNSAWQALLPNSLLVFDISTIMNSQTYFADSTQYTVVRDGYLVHRAEFRPHANRQGSRLTLFRKQGELFQRLEESHTQRVYRLEEILRLIDASALELVGIFSPETRNNLLNRRHTDLDWHFPRLFFVLKKVL